MVLSESGRRRWNTEMAVCTLTHVLSHWEFLMASWNLFALTVLHKGLCITDRKGSFGIEMRWRCLLRHVWSVVGQLVCQKSKITTTLICWPIIRVRPIQVHTCHKAVKTGVKTDWHASTDLGSTDMFWEELLFSKANCHHCMWYLHKRLLYMLFAHVLCCSDIELRLIQRDAHDWR